MEVEFFGGALVLLYSVMWEVFLLLGLQFLAMKKRPESKGTE